MNGRLREWVRELSPYVVGLLAFWIILSHESQTAANQLRDDINSFFTRQCETSQEGTAAIFVKYNDLVSTLILDYKQREKENLSRGDKVKAGFNKTTYSLLGRDLIVYRAPNCANPILPRR